MEINEIGLRIKKRRKELGITQKELGRRISRAEVTVQQYESGIRFPNLEARLLIATALDCEYEDLFDREIHIGRGEGLPPDELHAWFDKKREEAAKERQQIQPSENKPNETSPQPAVDTSDLTDHEIRELQIYRDFLIFRRGQ